MISYIDNAADFYLGRGEDAKYLGTRILDSRAETLNPFRKFQNPDENPFTEDDYRDLVLYLVTTQRWPWDDRSDSTGTSWTYMYDRGSVYVYHYGVEMGKVVCNYGRHNRDRTGREPRDTQAHQFPTITPAKSAT